VAAEIDFLMLYKILGLNADCELDEFKLAYRRRVAVLHPDRRPDGANAEVATERLRQLTTLYGSAMAFQRQHGRLPGAAAPPRLAAGGGRAGTDRPPSRGNDPVQRPAREPKGAGFSPRWLIVLVFAALVWLLWPRERTTPESSTTTAVIAYVGDDSAPQGATPPAPAIALGMGPDAIRAIEGPPGAIVSGERWEYGPSWIRFENNKVVDWYSSPQRPLDAPAHPPPAKE
jgi:hypothetical protein